MFRYSRKTLLALALGWFATGTAVAQNPPYFVGSVKLGPSGCPESQPKCTLLQTFGYVDRRGIGWQADAGFETDGASIPKWAQFFAGEPWDPSYLQAAVLHDWYSKSERPVYGWLQTQRMFREVLLQSGVSLGKANLLYAGVLLGSGKWIWRAEGRKCNIGTVCIKSVGELTLTKVAPIWESNEYEVAFGKIKEQTAALASASAEEIEALVAPEMADPVFVEETDGVVDTNSPLDRYLRFQTK